MYAIVATAFGGPEVLAETELPDPTPGPGQVAINTTHAAVGLVDVLLRRGELADTPGLPRPPFVPGGEVAGTVRALGAGVRGLRVGEPVVTMSQATLGGYASVSLADASTVIPLGDSQVDPVLAVAALPYGVTSYLALTRVAHLQPGETVLVHGAAGGLAATVPAVARSLGASSVIGTVSSLRRIPDTDHLGYDAVLTSDTFVEQLGGQTVDVVADAVGGDVRSASLEVLAPLGRILLLGHAANTPDAPVTGDQLWLKNAAMMGFSIGLYLQTHPGSAQPAAAQVLPLIADGRLRLNVEKMPLSKASEAHERLESRLVPGRIVLTI